jgi:hypothetical protein
MQLSRIPREANTIPASTPAAERGVWDLVGQRGVGTGSKHKSATHGGTVCQEPGELAR